MNELKYTLYFTQLLLSIENNNNNIQDVCLKLNKELEDLENDNTYSYIQIREKYLDNK